MNNKYKFDWVNNGIEFTAPKISAEIDLEILDFMSKQPTDLKDVQRNIIEFIETVYLVFSRVDKNITRDTIKQQLSVREIGNLVFCFRTQDNTITKCPHCDKPLSYNDIYPVKEVDKNFHKTQSNKKDIIVTKKEN